MWREIFKMTDTYKSLPHEVKEFRVEQVGKTWYIYAEFADRKRVAVGRYKTYEEVCAALKVVKDITNSNNI